ncbi:MAG: hypothetical protein M1501_04355 [Candidatus Omnitrophica bacterium]|nr:hypothetical protein [Candidatus Omnitrophota bacterium]
MNMKKMEKEVKKNSLMLDKEMDSFIKSAESKYVVYNKGKSYIADTLKNGVELGIKNFGEDTGFAVKKITKSMPILSSLVKI